MDFNDSDAVCYDDDVDEDFNELNIKIPSDEDAVVTSSKKRTSPKSPIIASPACWTR